MPEPWDYGRGDPRPAWRYAPSQTALRRGRDHNVFRLPDGPWFPWSREFRWHLMPWNRRREVAADEHRRRIEKVVLLEAAGATIGPVARSAGLGLNAGGCVFGASSPAGRNHAVLYEGQPEEVSLPQFPGGERGTGGPHPIDLWVHWYPESGEVSVDLEWFNGPRGLEAAGRPDLIDIVIRPATDAETLREVLEAYAAGLSAWLDPSPGDEPVADGSAQ